MTRLYLRLLACVAVAALSGFRMLQEWKAYPGVPLGWFLREQWMYAGILIISLLLFVVLLASARNSRTRDSQDSKTG